MRSWTHDAAPWTHPGAEFYGEEQRNGGLDYVFLRNDGQAYRWARADPAHFRLLSAGRLFSAFAVDEP